MYRNIFLVLLAANLVFLGLQMVTADDRAGQARTVSDNEVPTLALVDEPASADDVTKIISAPSVNSDLASDRPRRCLSLGPFSNEQELLRAQKRLEAQGMASTVRHAPGQIWVGYWIFLPATAERDTAVAKVEALREQGVRDIYIEPAGERENAVSLGVFSERDRAQRRFRQIRDLGFEPQIARRTREGTVFWLDFVSVEGLRVDLSGFQVAAGRIVRLASRACPDPTVPLE